MRYRNELILFQNHVNNASKTMVEKWRVAGRPGNPSPRTAGRAEAPGGGYRGGFITLLLLDCKDCKTGD